MLKYKSDFTWWNVTLDKQRLGVYKLKCDDFDVNINSSITKYNKNKKKTQKTKINTFWAIDVRHE